jgi:hypothetical protein
MRVRSCSEIAYSLGAFEVLRTNLKDSQKSHYLHCKTTSKGPKGRKRIGPA